MRVKQPGSGSGLLWIAFAPRPNLDQLADAGIGALVTGLFQRLDISPDLFYLSR
jgi:hypothetical protein